jgi:hypothetical protein
VVKDAIRGVVFVVGLGTIVLGAVGCRTVRGGGWIVGRNGGKATFGFQLVCNQQTNGVSGQIDFQDPSDGVRIHGVATQTPFDNCLPEGQIFSGAGEFYGTCRPQSTNAGPGGYFHVFIDDNGKPGPSPDDVFEIDMTGGVYDGYFNEGTLGGGNVTAF